MSDDSMHRIAKLIERVIRLQMRFGALHVEFNAMQGDLADIAEEIIALKGMLEHTVTPPVSLHAAADGAESPVWAVVEEKPETDVDANPADGTGGSPADKPAEPVDDVDHVDHGDEASNEQEVPPVPPIDVPAGPEKKAKAVSAARYSMTSKESNDALNWYRDGTPLDIIAMRIGVPSLVIKKELQKARARRDPRARAQPRRNDHQEMQALSVAPGMPAEAIAVKAEEISSSAPFTPDPTAAIIDDATGQMVDRHVWVDTKGKTVAGPAGEVAVANPKVLKLIERLSDGKLYDRHALAPLLGIRVNSQSELDTVVQAAKPIMDRIGMRFARRGAHLFQLEVVS